jgi:hypothetical protein
MNPHDNTDGDPDIIAMNPPPPPRSPRWRRPGRPVAVAGVALVALAGGATAGYAVTQSSAAKASDTAAVAASTPSPSASGKPWSWPGRHAGMRLAGPGGGAFMFGPGKFGGIVGGAVHGQLTVPKSGGGYQTVDVQRGTVTAVSSTSVTVKSADGYTASYAVNGSTVVNAKAAGIGSVKTGDTIFVSATASGSTATAASITDMTAIKAGHAAFGFPDRPKIPAPTPSPSGS